MTAAPALELDRLDVRHGSVAAVRGLSLQVGRGEIVGLVPAAAGSVRLAGREIAGQKPEAIARAGLALVPEGRRI